MVIIPVQRVSQSFTLNKFSGFEQRVGSRDTTYYQFQDEAWIGIVIRYFYSQGTIDLVYRSLLNSILRIMLIINQITFQVQRIEILEHLFLDIIEPDRGSWIWCMNICAI